MYGQAVAKKEDAGVQAAFLQALALDDVEKIAQLHRYRTSTHVQTLRCIWRTEANGQRAQTEDAGE
eukprot:40874-Eustigmatos_ZCMA.PRE.1